MSRLPLRCFLLLPIAIVGCMNQPMYQQYPYGQQMYGPQGYTQPGTLVIPPNNAAPYEPGGGGTTYENNSPGADDFQRDNGSEDDKFYPNGAGGVPPAKDPATNSSDPELPGF
jgi:hypothetical protein